MNTKTLKQQLISLGLFGFPLGVTIGYVITILVSLGVGDGRYYAVNEPLIAFAGGELNAVMLQALLGGILGMGYAMASVVWDIDSWSLARKTAVYLVIGCVLLFPISYIAHWMPRNVVGVLVYVGIFVVIFVVVWLAQYMIYKRQVNEMNSKLSR